MSAIYLIKTPSGERLIEANSRTTAINHAVKSEVTAKSLTAVELADYLQRGFTVEKAGTLSDGQEIPASEPNASEGTSEGSDDAEGAGVDPEAKAA